MAELSELDRRAILYLEGKYHERRGEVLRSKRGVGRSEFMRDLKLDDLGYSRLIAKLQSHGIVPEVVAQGATGEFFHVDGSVVGLADEVKSASPPDGNLRIDPPETVGQVIAVDSNIELLEEHDSGCYGTVWKGRQIDISRFVAVKIIVPEYSNTPNTVQHARGLAKAGRHKNVVEVYQIAKVKNPSDGKFVDAVIMEWV